MFIRFGKILVVLALVAMLGAHWAALHTVAWTAMLAENLRTHSFSESIVRTFDGKHPCPLCQAIAAGKQSEKKGEFNSPPPKLEFTPAGEEFVVMAPSQFELLPEKNDFSKFLTQKPLLPPPRGLFV